MWSNMTDKEKVIWNRLQNRFPGLGNQMDHTVCLWAARLEGQENIRHYFGKGFNSTYYGQVTLYSPYLKNEHYTVRLDTTKDFEQCAKETMEVETALWEEYLEQREVLKVKPKPKRKKRKATGMSTDNFNIPEPDID